MRCLRLLLAGLIVLVLTACANDHQRTCAEGATVGAAAGAAVGNIATKNSKGTTVGGLVGAGIGALYGCKVAEDKADYSKREADLKASADRANAAAQASKAETERLGREVAALDKAVSDLHTAQMTQQAKRAAGQDQQRQLAGLRQTVDKRLKVLNEEIARQNALIESERVAAAAATSVPAPKSEGIVFVSAGIRELEQQGRALELVKLQLQQIDRRRAY